MRQPLRKPRLHMIRLIIALPLLAAVGAAGTVNDRNLQTCMSGKYPSLCNHRLLTTEQLAEARAAEKRENLRLCLLGKYTALCNHSLLTTAEAARVREAESRENWTICASGKYRALCNHEMLTAEQLAAARAAEKAENLRICMDGRYSALCDHSKLTPEEGALVRAAEAKARTRVVASGAVAATPGTRSRCESGHWIEEVEGDGKIIKLEDGSLWEVDDIDTVTTSIWLPVSEVVLCGTTMINSDDDESVTVTRLASPGTRGLSSAPSKPSYVVQASANDETFIINDEVFKAKTYCFNIEKGDRVIFIDGSPFGACASAKIVNLRTNKTCELWCE